MRHGQNSFQQTSSYTRLCDSPLTDFGIYQAQIAGQYFREQGITFDTAFSSTSERACDTLEIVTDGKMPYERIKRSKRIGIFGVFEGEK